MKVSDWKARKKQLKKMKEKIDELELRIRDYEDELRKAKREVHQAIYDRDVNKYNEGIRKVVDLRTKIDVLRSILKDMKADYEKAYWNNVVQHI